MTAFDTPHSTPERAAPREADRSVLMADPEHFDIEYVINAHMAGHIGDVDTDRARKEWQALADVFVDLGLELAVLPAVEGFPDFVFAANQSFPLRDGTRRVVLSNMAQAPRRGEVPHYRDFYLAHGFTCLELPPGQILEGMGDVLWHPERRFAYGAWGFRTQRRALDLLATLIEAPVLALELVDQRFYHLDTCLAPLDARCALFVEQAFTREGVASIRACFPEAVAIPVEEGAVGFACNGVATRGHFIVQAGCPEAVAVARDRGLEVIELDTSEFRKSGGSVGCLHMRLQEAW